MIKKIFFRQKVSNKSICCICNNEFDDNEMTNIDELALCPKDIKLYDKYEWELYKELRSNPEDPDNALHIQELKDKLASQGILGFIKSTYTEDTHGHLITIFRLYTQMK